jgi:non-canonical (house-cleaning) NTP pyrophosphatase
VKEALDPHVTRRELLKLSPLLLLGGFAVPAIRDRLLGAGVAWSEGGLDPLASHGHHYVLKTWAAVTDGTRWGFGAGGAIVLPDAIAREVLEGLELGDVIDERAGTTVRGTRGAWGVLTLDLVGRQDSFRSAILAAVAPFYNPALYQA